MLLHAGLNIGFYFSLLIGRQRLNFRIDITNTIVRINAKLFKRSGMLFINVFKISHYRVAKDDGIGNLHHRGFDMHGIQDVFFLSVGDFGFQKCPERLRAHLCCINHVA